MPIRIIGNDLNRPVVGWKFRETVGRPRSGNSSVAVGGIGAIDAIESALIILSRHATGGGIGRFV
jgi:hypothetical protein